jgi:hypothetical protein
VFRNFLVQSRTWGITKISFLRSEQGLRVSQLELFWLHICIYNRSKNQQKTGTRSRPTLDGVQSPNS